MASPKRLPYTTAGTGGGARRGSGTVPRVVVLVFLFVIAPSIFFVVRSGGHVHVASDPKGANGNQETDWQQQLVTNHLKSILSKEVIDAIAASQQETGALNLDFFRDHASPSWKTDDLVDKKMNTSLDVGDKEKAENSTAEHDSPLTNKAPKDRSDEHQVDTAAKIARRKLREKLLRW